MEIRGLDIYDPTTRELRSSSVDDIARWSLDTAYDGESFFVRHAYFTGADDPYDKLRRAEISEDCLGLHQLDRFAPLPAAPPVAASRSRSSISAGDEVLMVAAVQR